MEVGSFMVVAKDDAWTASHGQFVLFSRGVGARWTGWIIAHSNLVFAFYDEIWAGSFMASAKDDAWTPKVKVSSYYIFVRDVGTRWAGWAFGRSNDRKEVGSFMGGHPKSRSVIIRAI